MENPPNTLKELSHSFDFHVYEGYGARTPFHLAAEALYNAREPEVTRRFRYGEYPLEDGAFYAIYADVGFESKWVDIEKRQRRLFSAVVRELGTLGLKVVEHADSEINATVFDQGGREVAIHSGSSLSGGSGDITHWGVNEFPGVALKDENRRKNPLT